MALTMRDRAVAYTCKDEVDIVIYDHAKRIGGIAKIGTQCGAPERSGRPLARADSSGSPRVIVLGGILLR